MESNLLSKLLCEKEKLRKEKKEIRSMLHRMSTMNSDYGRWMGILSQMEDHYDVSVHQMEQWRQAFEAGIPIETLYPSGDESLHGANASILLMLEAAQKQAQSAQGMTVDASTQEAIRDLYKDQSSIAESYEAMKQHLLRLDSTQNVFTDKRVDYKDKQMDGYIKTDDVYTTTLQKIKESGVDEQTAPLLEMGKVYDKKREIEGQRAFLSLWEETEQQKHSLGSIYFDERLLINPL